MKKYLAKKRVKELLKTSKDKIKLNVGCGTDYKPGWINIDNNSDNNIEKIDLNWDLRNPLPFPDGSVDYIFNEHFIEHLTVEEGHAAIKDFMRVLKKGGVLRIATPDLETVVKQYLNPRLEDDPLMKNWHMSFILTRAESINMSFRFWGHRWIYDWEELQRRAKEGGSNKIKRCKLNQSDYLELRNLETREESELIVEIVK